MVVYLLYSNWMHNGDNAVNEVIGVYDCLRKAQQSLAECLNLDLQNRSFQHMSSDSDIDFQNYNIPELAAMSFDDEEFDFDVKEIRLWNGNEAICCEDFQQYNIEQRVLL